MSCLYPPAPAAIPKPGDFQARCEGTRTHSAGLNYLRTRGVEWLSARSAVIRGVFRPPRVVVATPEGHNPRPIVAPRPRLGLELIFGSETRAYCRARARRRDGFPAPENALPGHQGPAHRSSMPKTAPPAPIRLIQLRVRFEDSVGDPTCKGIWFSPHSQGTLRPPVPHMQRSALPSGAIVEQALVFRRRTSEQPRAETVNFVLVLGL
jgi:hypothetical protein